MTAEDILAYIEPNAAIAFMLDPSHGTGTTGDWIAASAVATRVPLWLAGGLTPENVAAAIRDVDPWLVDVSTGVETDGAKNVGKIAAFIAAVRSEEVSP
jgi:phosphoribosylanthranilate isomerase